LGDDNALDGCATDQAGFACAPEDKKLVLKISRKATGPDIVLQAAAAQCAATPRNARGQDMTHGLMQAHYLVE
jgi:hypothetical protein